MEQGQVADFWQDPQLTGLTHKDMCERCLLGTSEGSGEFWKAASAFLDQNHSDQKAIDRFFSNFSPICSHDSYDWA